jgi:hypothetical protein
MKLVAIWCALALVLGTCMALCGACSAAHVPPARGRVCGADVDCRDGQVCRFPAANTRAVCRPSLDSPDYYVTP